jgi:hypothetical protein
VAITVHGDVACAYDDVPDVVLGEDGVRRYGEGLYGLRGEGLGVKF